MHNTIQSIVNYGTLFTLILGVCSLVLGSIIYRRQMNAQIFFEIASGYRDLQQGYPQVLRALASAQIRRSLSQARSYRLRSTLSSECLLCIYSSQSEIPLERPVDDLANGAPANIFNSLVRPRVERGQGGIRDLPRI